MDAVKTVTRYFVSRSTGVVQFACNTTAKPKSKPSKVVRVEEVSVDTPAISAFFNSQDGEYFGGFRATIGGRRVAFCSLQGFARYVGDDGTEECYKAGPTNLEYWISLEPMPMPAPDLVVAKPDVGWGEVPNLQIGQVISYDGKLLIIQPADRSNFRFVDAEPLLKS